MSNWPPPAWITLVVVASAGVVGIHQTYVSTQESWRSAGINNGRVAETAEIFQRLQASNALRKCPAGARNLSNRVLSVKTHEVYVVDPKGAPFLCAYE